MRRPTLAAVSDARVFWPLCTVAAAGQRPVDFQRSQLCLRRPDVQVFNVRIASAFYGDYSADLPISDEPLSPTSSTRPARPRGLSRHVARADAGVQPATPALVQIQPPEAQATAQAAR